MITASHFGVRHETGANPIVLGIGVASTATVLIAFTFTTLVDEPATAIALVVIVVISVVADQLWKRSRQPGQPQSVSAGMS
jgi:hypothetical protein